MMLMPVETLKVMDPLKQVVMIQKPNVDFL